MSTNIRPQFRNASGVPYELQAGLWGMAPRIIRPLAGGTTLQSLGLGTSTTGTATARTPASTSLLASIGRVGYVSSATAGSSAGVRHGVQEFWTGNAAGLGGFFFICRFGIAQIQANMRWLVGIQAGTAALANGNPSALLNLLGFGIDSGQTTVHFLNNDGVGVATSTDLGVNFPATTANAVYEVRMFCAPNSTQISYSIDRLDVQAHAEGMVSADIPNNTTFLSPYVWINNGATAAAVAIDLIGQYVETDF